MKLVGSLLPEFVVSPPFALTSLGDTLCRLLLPSHGVNGVGECHDGAADKYTHSAAGMDFNPYQWCGAAVLSLYVLMQFDRRAVENCCEEGRRERLNRGSDAEKEEEKKIVTFASSSCLNAEGLR